MSYARIFEREHYCRDIVRRLGALPPSRVHIINYPVNNPVAVFNACGILVGDYIELYARMVVGYYMYVSTVIRIPIQIGDILDGGINEAHYVGEIIIYPSIKYDLWGVEDPRVTRVKNLWVMVYSGRTINYFNSLATRERVLPMITISNREDRRNWKKVGVFIFPEGIRERVITDKDAFLLESPEGALFLFHRPYFRGCEDMYHLAISKVDKITISSESSFAELEVGDTIEIMKPHPFERDLGWGPPLVEVEHNRYIALIYAVDKETQIYRVFAALFRFHKGKIHVESVTPYYIFEPKEVYEVYGDRLMVIFPCGLIKIDDELIVIYEAGDYVIGFGSIEISELLSLLE